MPFDNEQDAITFVFRSIGLTNWRERGLDENTRDTSPTQQLLLLTGLPTQKREYAIVTGSKGKGSVTTITAKLLQSLGHKVGMVTSPHLTTYRQRFRINGKMISEADLIRLINWLEPYIEQIQTTLNGNQYLSPQGIFLALALKWFDENEVNVAVVEVGRGGRFDDNALLPNMLSMFTPILLEHTRYLGDSVARIAWHKAGIIKPASYAYSLPQTPDVMQVLRTEAESKDATFEWLAPADMGQVIEETADGQRISMTRYGEVEMPLLGHYEVDNASLAVWGAGNMHGRLNSDITHSSSEYVERIRMGLANVVIPGRCQKLQDNPAVYIDGAMNLTSADLFIKSVKNRLTFPVVTVLAIAKDRQYSGVYQRFAEISDMLIITETKRNITIAFPDEATALATAGQYHDKVVYMPTVAEALDLAVTQAGQDGTVLMSVGQPAIGDTMDYYGLLNEQI